MSISTHTHLRKDLLGATPTPLWPPGAKLERFAPEQHSKPAHALLVEAYRGGGGQVASYEDWWAALRSDPEYDPAVFFLAVDGGNHVVGLAQCWISAYLKDLAVAKSWQCRGIGQALVLHAFAVFRARGAIHLDLKVEDDNPSGAGRLYQQLGMRPVSAG